MIILMEGNEATHERFIEQVENTKYPIEGDKFKGYSRPNISEIKLYDIRVQQEHAEQLMKDLKIMNVDSFGVSGNSKHHLKSPFNFVKNTLFKIFRLFFGFKKLNKAKSFSKHSKPHVGWAYKLLIGAKKDPKKKEKDLL